MPQSQLSLLTEMISINKLLNLLRRNSQNIILAYPDFSKEFVIYTDVSKDNSELLLYKSLANHLLHQKD